MPMLGLDIGKNRFRAIEVVKEKDAFVIVNYGYEELPHVSFNLNSKESLAEYHKAIRHFMHEHAFSTSNVVVAIPEQDVFIRTITVPKMNYKDLKKFIELGAEEYIPLPINEVTFDVQIIEADLDVGSADAKMDALLVVSRTASLGKFVDFLKGAGLVPKGIEPETLAMERVLGDTKDRAEASLIANVGHSTTELIITYKGFVRFTRSVPIGGDAITKAIQEALNLDHDQASEYKKTYGLDESYAEGKVAHAIHPIFQKIIGEITRLKAYYATQNSSVIINRVIISGATALMPGLLLYIANNLDVEVELANPWRAAKFSKKLEPRREELMSVGPLYATALGLAMKEV